MKLAKQEKDYLLKFLLQSNSLNDLLDILKSICNILELDYLNPRIKHFKYFQFTFFGLIVRSRGILEMMLFRCEFLKRNHKEFEDIYSQLIGLKKNFDRAYRIIRSNKMNEGKESIIKLAEEYSTIFKIIIKLSEKV